MTLAWCMRQLSGARAERAWHIGRGLEREGTADCSAILLGSADSSVKHECQTPASRFWKISSENQPSAHGKSTKATKRAGSRAVGSGRKKRTKPCSCTEVPARSVA